MSGAGGHIRAASPPGFVRPRPVEDPELRLLVFHHAGGSAAAYYPLVHSLPPTWDLVLIDLPGRGKRHRVPTIGDMAGLVSVAAEDVLGWAGPPIGLFGHSLGAIVAAEAARTVIECVDLAWLGVSARPAPDRRVRTALDRPDLSDEELLRELAGIGHVPGRIDEVPEFRDRFLRLVRADLRALGSYRPALDRTPLRVPVTAFGGTQDPLAPPDSVAAWEQETTGSFRRRLFIGAHFYFLGTAFPRFGRVIRQEIQRSLTFRSRVAAGLSQGTAAPRPITLPQKEASPL
ncbi:alpha/beta fold hydrolase [Streptosporangium sp. LJ11]|uniref:thioesterase II family protein n=1 Tax=Streptosporangium sp. LJ11 TaxID=3436927 RepID=UPI003F7B294F